jgi:alcohol dehydrogenase
VRLGVALGAERVVAAGRSADSLEAVAHANGPRVVPVALHGEPERDAAALREAAGGGAHMALDMVGGATNAISTLAALRGLYRHGRLVLMGGMNVPVPVPYMEMMANSWEIIGNFMYPADAYLRLLRVIRAGLLDPRSIRTRTFPLDALPAAMDAARSAKGSECVVMAYGGPSRS